VVRSPFTIYVITVKQGSEAWHVFRRYREWEDLRKQLHQQLGSAPPMPPKQLFGNMRPEAHTPQEAPPAHAVAPTPEARAPAV